MDGSSRPKGPIEMHTWPEQLNGHVVTPGDDPRMHGYSVECDLAHHYGLTEVTLLALLGELPSDERVRAFEVAMTYLAPASIAEAPAHAAALAQICGSPSVGVLQVAAIGLAERARSLAMDAQPALEWLNAPDSTPGSALLAESDAERAAVQRLRLALAARNVEIPALSAHLSRANALVATLWFAGLRTAHLIELALVMASLPCAVAEAHRHGVASFHEYPIELPPFEYREP